MIPHFSKIAVASLALLSPAVYASPTLQNPPPSPPPGPAHQLPPPGPPSPPKSPPAPPPQHQTPRPPITCHPKHPHKPPHIPPPRHKTCYVRTNGNGSDDSKYILDALHDCNNGGHVVFKQGYNYTIGTALDLTFLKHIDIGELPLTGVHGRD